MGEVGETCLVCYVRFPPLTLLLLLSLVRSFVAHRQQQQQQQCSLLCLEVRPSLVPPFFGCPHRDRQRILCVGLRAVALNSAQAFKHSQCWPASRMGNIRRMALLASSRRSLW